MCSDWLLYLRVLRVKRLSDYMGWPVGSCCLAVQLQGFWRRLLWMLQEDYGAAQPFWCASLYQQCQIPGKTTSGWDQNVTVLTCFNFKRWGNFSINALGIDSNVCFLPATGISHDLVANAPESNLVLAAARQVLWWTSINISTFLPGQRAMTTMILPLT